MATTCGEGFYTIGPCGEVRHATTGRSNTSRRRTVASHRPRPVPTPTTHHRRSSEPTHAPTHARHAATRLHRMDHESVVAEWEKLLLDRARGYTVSSLDPVTGGAHCALGGGSHDFIVTSTLASQVR